MSDSTGGTSGSIDSAPAGYGFTDVELTELALGADPLENLERGASPLPGSFPDDADTDLPCWYMPPATNTTRSTWRTAVVLVLIASFVMINGLGLCITYGYLEIA